MARNRSQLLTTKQAHAVVLDAQGHTRKEICEVVGIAERTIDDWRTVPAYVKRKEELVAAGASELESQIRRLRERSLTEADAALTTLGEIVRDSDAGTVARLEAAKQLIALAEKVGLAPKPTTTGPGNTGHTAAAVVVVKDERSHLQIDPVIDVEAR